jgi:mono/diheme cytochrome c family protein
VTERAYLWTAAFCAAVVTASIADMTIPVAAQQPASSSGDQAQIELGTKAYAQRCSHCHGPNMVNAGTITPDLRRFPEDKERFFTTVKLGKNGRMPPWGDLLSDDEIASLWAYISSRRDR